MTWKICNDMLNGVTASEPAQPRAARARTGKGRRFAGNTARLCLACLVLLNAACAHLASNDKPLDKWTPELEQRAGKQLQGDRSADLSVLVAFSGGGTRASAFAYGVLQELAATEIVTAKGSHPLLHEVDMISSVSGGSFTAAYYGLYGEQIFTDFEPHFLRKDVEGILFRKLFNPVNWPRLLSSAYGRSDLAAEYYDKALFDGATFARLQQPDRPLVVINATDLASGERMPFVPENFDMLCADFAAYPVSRAVAASSAVPVILSPITLENFAGRCGYQPPAWVAEALKGETLTRRKIVARDIQDLRDRNKRPWLHLVDGGISDNLGMRTFYDTLSIADDPATSTRDHLHLEARRILIISVNAYAKHKSDWILERYAPSLFEVIGRVSADQISRYSEDTVQLVRDTFENWVKDNSTAERPVTFHFVNVSFNHVKDDDERDFLNRIGTNFDLSDKQVDRLIAAARQVLRESTEFQAFIKLNQGAESR
jgi:NTE family protein